MILYSLLPQWVVDIMHVYLPLLYFLCRHPFVMSTDTLRHPFAMSMN